MRRYEALGQPCFADWIRCRAQGRIEFALVVPHDRDCRDDGHAAPDDTIDSHEG